jgi:quinoprotein glucose dehydrogenase
MTFQFREDIGVAGLIALSVFQLLASAQAQETLPLKSEFRISDFSPAAAQLPAPPRPVAAPAPRRVADEAALLVKGRVSAQQNALKRLADQTDPEADKVLLAQFDRLDAGQLPPALWLELFEAAAKRDTPALRARLAERERIVEKAPDPLSRFRECLVGGDGEAGRLLFTTRPEAGCVRCHTVAGQGAQIGPDLTWLRHSVERLHLLESVILPNATIATGYANALLTLTNGEVIGGVITLESSDELTLTSIADGKKRTIKTAGIAERTSLPSPMPPIFGTVLSKRELRDLIEFLAEGD